jgi:hypothetical protein
LESAILNVLCTQACDTSWQEKFEELSQTVSKLSNLLHSQGTAIQHFQQILTKLTGQRVGATITPPVAMEGSSTETALTFHDVADVGMQAAFMSSPHHFDPYVFSGPTRTEGDSNESCARYCGLDSLDKQSSIAKTRAVSTEQFLEF